MAIDYSTDLGRLRLLISDVDESNLTLTDEQLTAFLDMEDGLKRAAAAALEAIATSELLVSKVIRSQDLQTDGAKVAAELRARAAGLRSQAEADDDLDDGGGLEIIDFNPDAGWEAVLQAGS